MQRSDIIIAHYYIIYTCVSMLLQLTGILATGSLYLKILAGQIALEFFSDSTILQISKMSQL